MASRGKTERTEKDMRENKDCTHRHTYEGIRNRWSEAEKRTGERKERKTMERAEKQDATHKGTFSK